MERRNYGSMTQLTPGEVRILKKLVLERLTPTQVADEIGTTAHYIYVTLHRIRERFGLPVKEYPVKYLLERLREEIA